MGEVLGKGFLIPFWRHFCKYVRKKRYLDVIEGKGKVCAKPYASASSMWNKEGQRFLT